MISVHRFGQRVFLTVLSFAALLAVHSVAAESPLVRLLHGKGNKRGNELHGKGHNVRCRGRDCHGEDDYPGTGTGARTANPGLLPAAPDDNGTDSPISPTAGPAGLPGLPVVPDDNGTDAPITGVGGTPSPIDDNSTDAPPVPGGALPVFPGGASTAPPSSFDPATTDSPFNPPTAAPTAAPNAVSCVCLIHRQSFSQPLLLYAQRRSAVAAELVQ
jgi:hypothetical protein